MGFDGRVPGDNPALEEVERLRAELANRTQQVGQLQLLVGKLDQERSKLREALGRFVANADRADSDDLADTDATYVVVAHLRRARAVLEETRDA